MSNHTVSELFVQVKPEAFAILTEARIAFENNPESIESLLEKTYSELKLTPPDKYARFLLSSLDIEHEGGKSIDFGGEYALGDHCLLIQTCTKSAQDQTAALIKIADHIGEGWALVSTCDDGAVCVTVNRTSTFSTALTDSLEMAVENLIGLTDVLYTPRTCKLISDQALQELSTLDMNMEGASKTVSVSTSNSIYLHRYGMQEVGYDYDNPVQWKRVII